VIVQVDPVIDQWNQVETAWRLVVEVGMMGVLELA
jgi:hypothetical protein